MRMLTGHTGKRYIPNSRIYQLARTIGMKGCAGENNPMYGRIGQAHPSYGRKDQIYNDEFRAKISATSKGRIPWNKGIKGEYSHSDEAKKKMSESSKGKPKSESHKRAISESTKGRTIAEVDRKHHSQVMRGRKRVYNADGTWKMIYLDF